MQSYEVYVCLISDQASPNLVPILSMNPRPKTVLLLVTDKMAEKAKHFQEVLKKENIHNVHKIRLTDTYDLVPLKQQIEDLLDSQNLWERWDQVAVNITGGTKLMSLATYTVFNDLGGECFYLTTDNQWMNLGKQQSERMVLKKFSIESLLMAQGYRIVHDSKYNHTKPLNKPKLTEHMVQSKYSSAISELYAYLHSDKPTQLSFKQERFTGYGPLPQLLDLFQEHGLITHKGDTITFASQDDLKFAKGGWFEEHVFHMVKSLPGIQDLAQGVQIDNVSTKATEGSNELDVVFTYNNYLHVIECKTVNYAAKHNKGEDKKELNRLDMLKKTGGLATKAMFASYKELDSDVRNRAKDNRIEIIEQKDLSGLKACLQNWLNK